MKAIIAGSRTITFYGILEEAMINCYNKNCWKITEVVSGGAKGIDTLGEIWAENNNIPIKRFPAEWAKYRKAAGHIRNVQMAHYGDILIAVWNGSPGTADMIKIMQDLNKPIYIHKV